MDGKKYFRDRCQALGVDHKALVKLGKSDCYFKTSVSHTFDPGQRTSSHRFVICYFSTLDVYVAWKLNTSKASGQRHFSLKKDELNGIAHGKVIPVAKNKEYSGWAAETVYAFCPDVVDLFIQNYLSK